MKRRDAILGSLAGVAALGAGRNASAASGVADLTAPRDGPISVAFVVGNGATVIDFAGPWEVFQDVMISSRGKTEEAQMPFRLALVSDKLDPVEATGGMSITPQFTYATVPALPNVLVMGAQGEHTPAKIEWIRKAAEHADVVMSVCTGAFLLAKTGLLDGRSATTHHDFYDAFERKFPKVTLVRGPRYVENGKIATAGGLTSGIELALRVVQRYFGDRASAHTAYYMEYNRSQERPRTA